MKGLTPASFAKWAMLTNHLVFTLHSVGVIGEEAIVSDSPIQDQVDDCPPANFDEGNLEIALELLMQHNEGFFDQTAAHISELHAQIIEHNSSENVSVFGIEEPRSFSEISDYIRDEWEALKASAPQIQIPVQEQGETVFFLDSEELANMSENQLYMVAATIQKMLVPLVVHGERVPIYDQCGQQRLAIEPDVFQDRWLAYLKNCELHDIVQFQKNGPPIVGLAWSQIAHSNTAMRYLELMAFDRLDNPEKWLYELTEFFALVIFGDDQLFYQTLKQVDQVPLDEELIDQLELEELYQA